MKYAAIKSRLSGLQVLRLLSDEQRTSFSKHILFSIVLALFEVFSLTSVLPLLFYLIHPTGSKSATGIVGHILSLTDSVSWITLLICVLILFLIKNIAGVWQTNSQLKFLNELYLSFSERIYHRFYSQPWSAYTHENSAEAFRKIKNTAFDFTSYVLNNYLLLITDVVICLLMIVIMAWFDFRILFVILFLFLPIGIFYYFFRKKVILKIDQSFRELTPVTNIVLTQGISAYTEARIYKKQHYFIKRFIELSRITTAQLSDLKTFSGLPARILEIAGILLFAGIVAYVKLGGISEQHVLVFIGLFSLALYRIMPSFTRMLQSLSQIQSYAYTVTELKETLGDSEAATSSAKDIAKIDFNTSIALHDVSFQYEDKSKVLLDHVTFEIRKGEFIVLEGPSGTGKTTLLHILSGIIANYKGALLIDGAPLTAETVSYWQSQIGLVTQSPVILQDTLLHNIAFGEFEDEVDNVRLADAIRSAGLDAFVKSLPEGIYTLIGENGVTLSGGQRQRLCLARALYRQPKVLLLDEVTNQLDEENKVYILSVLQRMCNSGKTVVLISHDPLVRKFASRILRLEDAALVQTNLQKQVG
ncbi:MAG TPA: ABC transporter ATP-binding protein [Ohtaekwangia sp.]|uniref:ABC transporter ATP-binding protein n=1 Tax=Ohtaekwangia sp. TaxID=2066019 RepID=UPI002F93EBC8